MDANERLHPIAVALHTRDRQEDYGWFIEVGDAELISVFKELHRELIADQDARPAATFVLLDQGSRLGLLVANLKTPRQDHLRTYLDDTLLLVFAAKDRETVFRLAAGLLAAEAPAIQRRFLDYAETQFDLHQKQSTGPATVEPLSVPSVVRITGTADLDGKLQVGLRSNEENQTRVAGLLHGFASRPDTLDYPFVVVSTGFVGRDKIQQHIKQAKRFIALSRSSSFPENEDVPLEAEEKKKSRRHLSRTVLVSLAFAGLLGITLLALRENWPNGSEKKSTAGMTKTLTEAIKNDGGKDAFKAATIVGIGATIHGNGRLSVLASLLAITSDLR